MMRKLLTVLALCGACGSVVLGDEAKTPAISPNIFGFVRVESETTNTLIAVPWTWYSKEEKDAIDLPVKRLVKTTNLEVGDLLYSYQTNGTYRVWTLVDPEVMQEEENHSFPTKPTEDDKSYTNLVWMAVDTVVVGPEGVGLENYVIDQIKSNRDPDSSEAETTMKGFRDAIAGMDVTKIGRGYAVWLRRQHPTDDAGNAKPFWIYGQCVQSTVTNEVMAGGGTAAKYSTTLLGNPYLQPVKINDLAFDGTIDTNDRIFVPNGSLTPKTLAYVKKGSKTGWRASYGVVTDGKVTTVSDWDVEVKPGLGFWYDRRGKGPMKIVWPAREAVSSPSPSLVVPTANPLVNGL